MVPSTSDAVAVKATGSGALPVVTSAEAETVGAWFALTVTVTESCPVAPSSSVTVNVAV